MSSSIQFNSEGQVVAERHSGPSAVQLDRNGAAAATFYSGPQQAGLEIVADQKARETVLKAQQGEQPEQAADQPPADTEGGEVQAEYVAAAKALGAVIERSGINFENVAAHIGTTGTLPAQVQEQILAGYNGDVAKANTDLGAFEAKIIDTVLRASDDVGLDQFHEDDLFSWLNSGATRQQYAKAWASLLTTGDDSGIAALVRSFHKTTK